MSGSKAQLTHIETNTILPGRNVRQKLHGINELAESLRQHGMLQPITVVPAETNGHVEVLFGHRRLAAAKVAKLSAVPCFLRPRGSEMQRLLTQAAENFDREDMTPLDEAILFGELRATGLSQEKIGALVRRHQTHVGKTLRLLDYPQCVLDAVGERHISLYDAIAIPLELCKGPGLRTLPRHLGDAPTLRRWVAKYSPGGELPRHAAPYGSCRILKSTHELATRMAVKRGRTLAEWVEEAITEKAAREAKR